MTKRVEFDAAHRLLNHESKCAHLHGHRYAVEVELAATGGLDRAGRIVDFGIVKSRFGRWLDENLDHATIVNVEDRRLLRFLRREDQKHAAVPFEPSAENLATFLLHRAARMLDGKGRRVVGVTLYETPTSSARVTR